MFCPSIKYIMIKHLNFDIFGNAVGNNFVLYSNNGQKTARINAYRKANHHLIFCHINKSPLRQAHPHLSRKNPSLCFISNIKYEIQGQILISTSKIIKIWTNLIQIYFNQNHFLRFLEYANFIGKQIQSKYKLARFYVFDNSLYIDQFGLDYSQIEKGMDIHKAVTIYNMCGVFSASVSTIDLSLLAVKMSNSSYNAKKIPALVIRKTNPKATILLFRTGKAIILGTQSAESLQKIVLKFGKELQKLLLIKELKCSLVQITNIMAGCNLDFKINLGKLSEDRKSIKTQGNPGVLYNLGEPVKKVLVHKSGKIIIVGAKSVEAVEQTYVKMKELMKEYELQSEQTFLEQN